MTLERIYLFDTTLRDGQQTFPPLPAAMALCAMSEDTKNNCEPGETGRYA